MKELRVDSSYPYSIFIGEDYSLLKEKVKEVFKGEKIAVAYDENTHKLFSKEINENLNGYRVYEIIFKSGEESKCAENYIKFLTFLAQNDFTRYDLILSVGGGVVGDLSSFVASTYMRGIPYVACPTTLLSCVDSSIGGKTGINLQEGKNLIGSFYSPKLVYISLNSLKTLPKREVESGMGEVVKYAFLSESITKEDIEKGISEELILKCLRVKKEIVEKDEFDRGERAKLNLGHTFGHSIENLSGYKYSHGLCVLKGIGLAIELSCKYYSLTCEQKAKMQDLLGSVEVDLSIKEDLSLLIQKIKNDKKFENGEINFVLIKEIGNIEIVKLTLSEVEKLLK